MSVNSYRATRHIILEDSLLRSHCCVDLKVYITGMSTMSTFEVVSDKFYIISLSLAA